MKSADLRVALQRRFSAFRAWSATYAARAYRGAKQAVERVGAWPWKTIGLWTGGALGVLTASLVLFLAFADWNAMRDPIARWASTATGRQIVIQGDLDVDPWSLTPQARVQGLRIGNQARFRERGEFAEIADAKVAVRLLPLFVGRFDIVRLDLTGAEINLYRTADGDANWASTRREGQRPLELPDIREFSLRDGHVRYEDEERRMLLDAAFTTRESADANDPGEFELVGEGELNNRPFTVDFRGDPLLNVRRGRPYPFKADIEAGGTRIEANGAIARPFNFNRWQADIVASGPDLAQLYDLIGLTLPNTPPYSVRGVVHRDGRSYGMRELNGTVGDSDLRGAFTATTNARTGRLFFDGDFVSSRLDFDDLMAVLGGAPSTGSGETASDTQRAIAANLAAQGRLLPDAPLDISRVRNMDANVTYRAARVRSDRFPLRGLSLDISLDQGLLRLDPMTLDLRQGRIGGAVAINAQEDTPHVDVDVRLTDARIENFITLRGNPPMTGALVGRARLSGQGASVRDAAANANGEVTLVSPHGEVREAFAELTGINVTRGLGLLLSEDQSKIAVRCGVASFNVRSGVMHARSMIFDTETMLIRGGGTISLRNETMDLRLEGEPKEARLIRLAAPITIQGKLRSPELGVDIGEAAEEGGIAALLGTLIAPLAAVLPFVDAGLADDANCAALLADRTRQTNDG